MEEDVENFIKNCQVIVIAGGQGSRLSHITNNAPKALIEINRKTLLEYCLELFSNAGFSDFIFLLGKGGEIIQEFILEKNLAPNSKFFIETERLGKGGALKNAITSGLINRSKPSLIVFPDDLFLDSELPLRLAERHLNGLKKGCKSTVLVTNQFKCDFGIAEIRNGLVCSFEEKPYINRFVNTGIFVFEPEIYELIENLIDMEKVPVEFESVVAPEMAKRNWIYSFQIPFERWIPINDEKGLKRATELLSK